MIVSSTEFQQNVGYYLGLVEKGEKITIMKNNNKNKQFKLESLVQDKPRKLSVKANKKLKLLSKIQGKIKDLHLKIEDGLTYQNNVRQ